MSFEEQDYKFIEDRVLDRVRVEFMPRSECDSQMNSMKESYHGVDVRLAVIESEVKKSTKLQWAVLIAVITAVVGAIMGLILK